MELHSPLETRRVPLWALLVTFTGVWVAALLGLSRLNAPEGNELQTLLYALVGATLLAGVATFAVTALDSPDGHRPAWVCPLAAGGIGLVLFSLAYLYLGVWPVGDKTIMTVDMHHQYAPLLSELRYMLLNGEVSTYSYHMGLGANFIPTFAYYLASPLNLLLLVFPERLLTVGILVITLLKGAAAAAAFTACAQYVIGQRRTGVVIAGLLYALSGYVLAYSWNIMWLDVVVLLPVVVLCMERMLHTGKIPAYALTLALALFVNYYIGFMLCVFLVLYMAVWLLRQPRSGKEWLLGCGRFALGSLLAGGLAACLLIPTALSLGRTSAVGEELGEFATNFPLFELVGRMMYGATPTIRSGNLPNLYCGVPAVLLLPIFLSHKEIPLRNRLCYGGLLGVLLLSCTITQWDLVWHGLHAPNDLPYRFTFLVTFVLLLMAAKVLTSLKDITHKQVWASLGGCAAYLVVWEMFGGKHAPDPEALYTNLLLFAIYGAALLVVAMKKAPAVLISRVMLVVVCLELLIGSGDTLMQINNNEVFTSHNAYLDNANTQATAAAVKRAQEIAAEEMGEEFYRMEYLGPSGRDTCVDTARHHYAGLTTFASSNPYQTTLFMGDLGYAINGVNSYIYHSFVASSDSLLGLRYLVLSVNIPSHPQLELLEKVVVAGQTRYIYRNNLALGLGYMADNRIKQYVSTRYDPFDSQESLYSALLGETLDLYDQVNLVSDTAGAYVNLDHSFYYPGGDATFSAYIEEEGQYFAYVDCRAADSIAVHSIDGDGSITNTWTVTTYEPFIIDMGTMQAGDSAEVWISGTSGATGNIHIVRLDAEAMIGYLDTLREGNLTITSMSNTRIEGTITAKEDGAMLLTIPYDKGWTVTVDGKPAKTFPLAPTKEGDDGAMLCVEMPAGDHKVTLVYEPPGLRLGILVSLCSLVALLLGWLIVFLWKRHKRRPVSLSAVATESIEPPAEPAEEKVLPLTLAELMQEVEEPIEEQEEPVSDTEPTPTDE